MWRNGLTWRAARAALERLEDRPLLAAAWQPPGVGAIRWSRRLDCKPIVRVEHHFVWPLSILEPEDTGVDQ